jgi:putative peptidoglycan lipid II flippase
MSNKLNEGDNEGFLTYLCKSIVIISLLLIPIAFAVILLNKEIITAFYGRNQFGSNAIILTSIALLGYSMQIPFLGIRDILNSSLFSMQKTKVTTINGIIGVLVNIILSITLSRRIGLLGVSIASSIASAVTAILLFYSTKKIIGDIDIREMIKSLIKITLSAFIMMVIVKIINNILGINNVFVILIIDGIVGSIIFFVGCIILKVKELNEMLDMLGNKLIRKEGS